jgi:rhamnosyltransferase
MSKVLAVVVSFHPDQALEENVRELLMQVDHVVIVDNQTSESSQSLFNKFALEHVTSLLNAANKGVAEGFNQGLRWGMAQDYEYFLLLDQDSRVQPGMVQSLRKVVDAYLAKQELALVGPRHEDFERKILGAAGDFIESAPLLITSGSLISKKLIEKVGLYDERLFIDHVDHDYCLRVIQNGGRCLKVNGALLLHKFGEARIKTFLGKSFFLQEYSAFRRYHMMRNRLVLYKRYGMFRGAWFWMDLRSAIKDLVKLICFETDKVPKLKAVMRGLWAGIRWQD